MRNYDKTPCIPIEGVQGQAWDGYASIVKEIQSKIQKNTVLVIDVYHGVDVEDIKQGLIEPLCPDVCIYCEDAKLPEEVLIQKIGHEVSEDRVFGSMSTRTLDEFYDDQKLRSIQKRVNESSGLTIVYGVGASLVTKGDVQIYVDINRWEIQLRYRKGLDNWGVGNYDEDILRKYKRGYFVEWRVLDRHKVKQFPTMDYIIDANVVGQPKMITRQAFHVMLETFATRPFRLVPYFDEGIWGGTWMEDVCGLEHTTHNMAWCFDGVPEENSIRASFGNVEIEFPAMNLVKTHPKELLGAKVYARFGAEFPIRFDFLDTINGGNLSLQVHPLTEYIKDHFGMSYTQDESYYILDAQEGAHVYLGVKDGVTKDTLIPALLRAQEGNEEFDATKYINRFEVKKHDHILIPAGTIHCSGAGTMVLEISATPYIFTFKLWDWGRVGLDGKPRPINVERGQENIQFDRTTEYCQEQLVSNIQEIERNECVRVERTGLHALEFIETTRYWLRGSVTISCQDSVNMLNVIEGQEVSVRYVENTYRVHYAETFIVPECVKEYTIEPCDENGAAVICARVRI